MIRLRLQVSGPQSGSLLGYRAPLADGTAGTAQTIALMRKLVDDAVKDPQFVRFAVDLVRNVPDYDEYGEVFALFEWVRGNIRYTKDPVTVEKLYPPAELLKIRAGDCDDISMLMGALAIALGYPARLVTVAADASAPNEFSHVYTEVEMPAGSGNWIATDAARPNSSLGLEPPVYYRKRAWSLTDSTSEDLKGCTRMRGLSGLSGLGDGVDWGSILQQSITESPAIIAATEGRSTSLNLPTGTVATGNPYGSFMTPYTPGYAIPAAGYGGLQMASSDLFSSALPWLLMGAVAIALFRKH